MRANNITYTRVVGYMVARLRPFTRGTAPLCACAYRWSWQRLFTGGAFTGGAFTFGARSRYAVLGAVKGAGFMGAACARAGLTGVPGGAFTGGGFTGGAFQGNFTVGGSSCGGNPKRRRRCLLWQCCLQWRRCLHRRMLDLQRVLRLELQDAYSGVHV